MISVRYLLWIGASTAVGTALGVLADPERPSRGGVIGAAAGLVAGSVLGGIHERRAAEAEIELYSSSSPLYQESDELGYT
ncbi:MAG: hypothetical protein AB1805_05240 [Nitrospirota bacterium]